MYTTLNFEGKNLTLSELKSMCIASQTDDHIELVGEIISQMEKYNGTNELQITLSDYDGSIYYKHYKDKYVVERGLKNISKLTPFELLKWLAEVVDKRRSSYTSSPVILAVFGQIDRWIFDNIPYSEEVEEKLYYLNKLLKEGPSVNVYVLATSSSSLCDLPFDTFIVGYLSSEYSRDILGNYDACDLTYKKFLLKKSNGEVIPFSI